MEEYTGTVVGTGIGTSSNESDALLSAQEAAAMHVQTTIASKYGVDASLVRAAYLNDITVKKEYSKSKKTYKYTVKGTVLWDIIDTSKINTTTNASSGSSSTDTSSTDTSSTDTSSTSTSTATNNGTNTAGSGTKTSEQVSNTTGTNIDTTETSDEKALKTSFVNDDQITQTVIDGIDANAETIAGIESAASGAVDQIAEGTGDALASMIENADFSAESLAFMKNNAINAGEAFLNGAVTSAFASQIDVYNSGKQMLSEGAQLLAQTPSIVSDIVSSTTKDVISYIQNYLTTYITEMLNPTPWMTGLTYYTSYYTTLATNSASTCLTNIITNMDKQMQEKIEKATDTDAKKSEKMEKFSYNMGKIRGGIEKATSYMQTGIEVTLAYIEAGPDWVKKQINTYVKIGEGYMTKYLDYVFADTIRMRDDFIEWAGESAGKAIAEKLNEAEEKALHDQIVDLKKTQRVASAKTLAALMKATAVIVAKLGPLVGKAIKAATKLAMKKLQQALEQAMNTAIEKFGDEIKKAEEKVNNAIDTASDVIGTYVGEVTGATGLSYIADDINYGISYVETKTTEGLSYVDSVMRGTNKTDENKEDTAVNDTVSDE